MDNKKNVPLLLRMDTLISGWNDHFGNCSSEYRRSYAMRGKMDLTALVGSGVLEKL
jgi:hypothetical protein